MSSHDFAFIVSGIDPHAEDFADRFFEAGCDDATLILTRGLVAVCFSREEADYLHAVVSAYRDVLKAGATVERFEPDFLVSQSEIAKRANLTKAAVSLYVSGERGADFPRPHARVTSSSPLWDWVEVSSWLHHHGQVGPDEVLNARLSRTINWFVQNPIDAIKGADRQLWRVMTNVAKEPVYATL
jgi:hypothetical protein